MEVSKQLESQNIAAPPAHKEKIDSPAVQVALALTAFAHAHPELTVYPLDRAKNEPHVRNEAMLNWTNGSALAQAYRDYLASGSQVPTDIDIDNSHAIEELLKKVEKYKVGAESSVQETQH